MDGSRILIFMDTKKGCDQITRQLRMDGWPALSIHGDKSQAERDWVLSEFKAGKSPIMTATDVAARGLGMFIRGNDFVVEFFLILSEVTRLQTIMKFDSVHCHPSDFHFLMLPYINLNLFPCDLP